jgi:hypothetical protein
MFQRRPILTGSFFLNRAFFPKDFVVPDSIRQDLYLLTFGVNYHFNPLPVVTAKLKPLAPRPPHGAGFGSRFNPDRAHKD